MMAPQAEACLPEEPLGTSPASPPAIVVTRPLFGGYALVAACAAWLGGVAVQRASPLAAWAPWIWLIGARLGGAPARLARASLLARSASAGTGDGSGALGLLARARRRT